MEYKRSLIDGYIESQRENMISDVRTLVRIPSVESAPEPGCPYGKANREALQAAAEMAQNMGFSARIAGDRMLVVDYNEKEPALGVVAHLDVVEAGSGWTDPPFDVTERDGVLFGRGTADNKGPAVCALYAIKALKENGVKLQHGVRILLGSAEETGCSDIAWYRTQEKLPPMTFTPDADYPVIHAEKGMHMPKFSASWSASDALPRVTEIHGGNVHNVVPSEVSAEVAGLDEETLKKAVALSEEHTGAEFSQEKTDKGFRIHTKGTASHVCEPYLGNNAQTALISLLAALPLADCGSTEAVRKLNKCFPHGDILGEAFGVSASDDLFGELYLSFTVLKLTETGFTAQYDCRCPACCTQENMADPVIRKLEDCGFEITAGRPITASHFTPPDSPLCCTLNRVYEEYTGNPGGCMAIGGFTYLHDVEGGVAFGCALPGAEPHFHTAQERFPVENMILSTKMFAKAIFDICNEEGERKQ